jgi:phosphate transport system substrate-binding protein
MASRLFGGVALALAVILAVPAAAGTLHLGGTGSATEPLRRIGARFASGTGIAVDIIAGLGSSGGISATAEGVLELAVSGRALSPGEEARDLIQVLTVCTPFVMATSHASPGSFDRASIAAIWAQAASTWPDGTPIRIVLRPKAESDNLTMAALFPGMEQSLAQARTRDTVPVGATDQDNADLAEQIPGSLIGTTYAQMLTEHRALRLVAINGEAPGIETFESGRYPFGKQLHMIAARHATPDADRFLGFLRSPDGVLAMREAGIVACPK